MRDSSIFYRSFYEAIKDLPPENQAEVYNAIFEYSLNLNEVELTGISKTIFTLVKPQIQANIKRFKNGIKAKKKKTDSNTEAKSKQPISKAEANNNVNANANVNANLNNPVSLNENVNVNENDISPQGEEPTHTLQVFIKSLNEVSKLKTQLTEEDCKALLTRYGESYVKEILLAMENTKGIADKYTSVYQTVQSWIQVRKSNVRINDPIAASLKRPFKPITPDQL